MQNGFYDLTKINTIAKRRKFFEDAILLSYEVRVEIKHSDDERGWHRQIDKTATIENRLNLLTTKTKISCIDRNIYNQGEIKDCDGEISLFDTTTDWKILYCFMNLENLAKLVAKYDLKLNDY